MAEEYDQKLIEVKRVARVVAGGRRFSFRTVMIVGDRKGKVGVGVAKGPDVRISIEKAVKAAKKSFITISLKNGTIPHIIEAKYGAAKVFLKPAGEGRGIIAGGPVRVICDLGGVQNVSAKIIGRTTNKINNARATIEALKKLKAIPENEQTKKSAVESPSKEKTEDKTNEKK